MRREENSPDQREFPRNWDVLNDSVRNGEVLEDFAPRSEPERRPPTINLLASSWADAVVSLGVCTAALFGLNTIGYNGSLTAFPWALALGAAWWATAATILVVIRQGTPGMLLAGIVFGDRVAPWRLAMVIAAAAVCALLLGLPCLLGARRSPLALAAASELESVPVS